jgi:hypothetical protein
VKTKKNGSANPIIITILCDLLFKERGTFRTRCRSRDVSAALRETGDVGEEAAVAQQAQVPANPVLVSVPQRR